jgi:hypothetical protein
MTLQSIKSIPLENLIVDLFNPRHVTQPNQREALATIALDQGIKLANLADDIAEKGLNPSELPLVTPSEEKGMYGRGECWDLAQQALDSNLADWTRPAAFGRPLNPETNEIKAGDIIQFRNLRITEHLPGGVTRMETLGAPDHTAVVYKVLGKKHYTLAHQNIGGKRSVMKSDINLADVTSGKYWIYRPVALMIRQ